MKAGAGESDLGVKSPVRPGSVGPRWGGAGDAGTESWGCRDLPFPPGKGPRPWPRCAWNNVVPTRPLRRAGWAQRSGRARAGVPAIEGHIPHRLCLVPAGFTPGRPGTGSSLPGAAWTQSQAPPPANLPSSLNLRRFHGRPLAGRRRGAWEEPPHGTWPGLERRSVQPQAPRRTGTPSRHRVRWEPGLPSAPACTIPSLAPNSRCTVGGGGEGPDLGLVARAVLVAHQGPCGRGAGVGQQEGQPHRVSARLQLSPCLLEGPWLLLFTAELLQLDP